MIPEVRRQDMQCHKKVNNVKLWMKTGFVSLWLNTKTFALNQSSLQLLFISWKN